MNVRVPSLGLLAGILVLISLFAGLHPVSAQSPDKPIVKAVMFWKAGCGHCEETINRTLPPIREKYGAQFDLKLVEVASMQDVDALYALAATYNIPKEDVGVPLLVLDKTALVGSAQISEELSLLLDNYLARGGVDLPDKPELRAMLSPSDPVSAYATNTSLTNKPTPGLMNTAPSLAEKERDNGFTLAVVVLVGMLAALVFAVGRLIFGLVKETPLAPLSTWQNWAIPVLSIFGLAVAIYLSYIEISLSQAFCGPIGDCNAVQASRYARLWGVLPVGVLGAMGYIAILAAWWVDRFRKSWGRLSSLAPISLFGMAFFGTLFSAYLTYLEPFVIKAVCIWCVTSAIIITLLLFFSLAPALHALTPEVAHTNDG